jgi:transposase
VGGRGCGGIGRHIAQRLVADGESVAGVPAKLSARARVFATGQGRKTDATDAHSVAVVALRAQGLQVDAADGATVALRLLADRRDGLGQARTDTASRLHRLLPGITARRGEEVPVRPAGPRPGGNRAAT